MPSRRPRRAPGPASHKKRAAATEAAAPSSEDVPRFTPLDALAGPSAPLIALRYRTAASQHAALARLEAFYEGAGAPRNEYVTLAGVKELRGGLCRNYEAFNLPLDAVHRWLAALRTVEAIADEPQWWRPFCNDEENELLAHLDGAGALHSLSGAGAGGDDDVAPGAVSPAADASASPSPAQGPARPLYVISVLSLAALPHELSHALFYLSPVFARAAGAAWDGLPRKSRSIIEHDLRLRGYAPEVWVDEFQAYIAENDAEFGQAARAACAEAEQELSAARRQAKIDIGVP
ncbi:hypothetical protein FA09DRAFT_329689 [Tilletiopsis washingtonensis]|jgi:hypothetical protein|uniref:Uncharacterized protein n=1 Tax=Tilletiopsis washingtonensis TaxID=58919 RepID=A0A316ZAN7_9BASI|nr:hypothetical protein FA09DRAFT_329689 [Tilletiopsis washingtonensis]PWN98641.1 hypothetical protein FA09DRAFT_329689 [Tilletiopsis washingtonensis]